MLVGGLLPHSDCDLDGQWLGCPPEGDAGQGSWACLHPGALPFRGRSLPATEAGTSLPWPTRADNLSEPSALPASWGGPGPRVAIAGCRRGSKLRVRRPLCAVSLVMRLQSQLTRFSCAAWVTD